MIHAENLTKQYRRTRRSHGFAAPLRDLLFPRYDAFDALREVNFNIGSGTIVGYLGPNGAGKSTTVKILTGVIRPTSGTVSVAGLNPQTDRRRLVRRIGAVFGQRTQLWWDLPVVASFELIRRLYQMSDEAYRKNLASLCESLELGELLRIPVRQLSLGQKMRAELGAALLHDPEVLFLDEPTIGLDVEAKRRIQTLLSAHNAEHNTTIVLTTHDISDIERLCQRIIIIDAGRVAYDGTLAGAKQSLLGSETLVCEVESLPSDRLLPRPEVFGGVEVAIRDEKITATYKKARYARGDVMRWLSESLDIRHILVEEPTTEALLREIYRGRPSSS